MEGTDQDYINQIMDYTEDAEHDDAPDSASCICRIYDKKSWVTIRPDQEQEDDLSSQTIDSPTSII